MTPAEIIWSGGEHPFLLRLGELRILEQKCDVGAYWVLYRLMSNQWYVNDVIETIRLGLIGGGMDHIKARDMTQSSIERSSLAECAVVAQAILSYSIHGDESQEGKQKAKDQN